MDGYKTILTFLGNNTTDKIVLDASLEIAKSFLSHIFIVNVKPDPIINFPYYGEGLPATIIPEMVGVVEKIWAAKTKNAEKMFNKFCSENNVKQIVFEQLKNKKNSEMIPEL